MKNTKRDARGIGKARTNRDDSKPGTNKRRAAKRSLTKVTRRLSKRLCSETA